MSLPGEFAAIKDEVVTKMLLPSLGLPDFLDDDAFFSAISNNNLVKVSKTVKRVE